MRRVRGGVAAGQVCLALVLGLMACSHGDGWTIGEPDRPTSSGLTVDEEAMVATILDGDVDVELRLERTSSTRAIDGTVALALLDLHDEELGTRDVHFEMSEGQGELVVEVPALTGVPEGTEAGDLSQYVVRYRVETASAVLRGRRSLFTMARRIAAVVLGADALYDEQPTQMRVVAGDPATGEPLGDAEVEVVLEVPAAEEGDDPTRLRVWRGETDELGMANIEFTPEGIAGPATVVVLMSHDDHAAESRHAVSVQRSHRILVTTDKPLYQPGQTMHLRALSLRLPDNQASGGAAVTFEVMDSEGNIVFREEHVANDYGVAATTFQLARMVNMGRYTIRATVDEAVQERTVTVERYALPRFGIGFEADSAFYMPGEELHGQVDVAYTFGQPVAGGTVTVRASQFDVDWTEFAELHGTLDDDGHWDFDVVLPEYFVGLPLDQGGSFVKLAIEVTDTAGQSFEVERAITVANGSISAVLVGERSVLAPGVQNEIFLLTADPTGTPVSTRCTVRIGEESPVVVETDERGFASFEVTPIEGEPLAVVVEAEDGRGGTVTASQTFSAGGAAAETVLLRTDQSLYEVGDTAELSIYSPRALDRVYLDVVRGGQTLLTDIVTVEDGWTDVPLDLSDQLAGSVTVSVYYLADSGDIVRDQRTIFVAGAADLSLRMSLDRPVYRPAETARLTVEVADQNGGGVQAAVGLQVVDEAVFALSEQQPGLERVYFQLEEELQQPSYEIHGFEPSSIFGEGAPDPTDGDAQDAARVLFAAQGGRSPFGIDFSSERQLSAAVVSHVTTAVQADAQAAADWLGSRLGDAIFGEPEETARRWVDRYSEEWYDPWGRRYQTEYADGTLTMSSSSADETWGTDDDVTVTAWVHVGGGWDPMPGGDGEWNADDDGFARDEAGGEMPPSDSSGGGGANPRIRTWFPETLFVEPSIITDEDGRATIEIPLADSITTWRASGMASSRRGAMGSNTAGITVFQEFFVDLALPATMTLGDEITVPVVVYNYLDEAQVVEIEVTPDDWFTLLSPVTQMVTLGAREVSSVPLRIRVDAVGWHDLQAVGRAGDVADGLRRRIEVMPSGMQHDEAQSDTLEGSAGGTRVGFDFEVPGGSVPDASELLVKVYPGVFAQAVEGLDSILRMPSGCFEQTSSSTYPNVLVLDYMQRSGTVTPEVEMRAREYINLGYQRLLTFEVEGGGFEWFGSPPAHKILTAYGLMEFSDMARVHPVDPAVIDRTARWLASQQEGDGSWTPDSGGIPEGAINNYQDSTFRTTAYVLWALLEAGYVGPEVSRAVGYLHDHRDDASDSYARVVAAHALLSADPDDTMLDDLLAQLAADAQVEDGAAHWGDEEGAIGMTYSMGSSHVLETTSLAVDVLLRARAFTELANQGITFLVRSKDSFGNWETTQATIYALRAFLRSMDSAGSDADATIDVFHNGDLVQSLEITPDNSDVLRQVDLKERLVEGGANTVELVMTGSGSLMYQVVGTYWTPWDEVPEEPMGPLSIDVAYDRTSLSVDDTVSTQVTLTNNTSGSLMMVMVDLGIAPGFDVATEDLDGVVASGVARRYELTGRQILMYLDELPPGPPVTFNYRLIARNPMRGEAPPASTYLYYEPDIRVTLPPVGFEVD